MKNIVFTRIDDRLIHGQVMTMWIQFSGANEVLIADDATAKDKLAQIVMKSSIPGKVSLKILSIADAIEYLKGEDDGKKKVFLLVKLPSTLVSIADAGIELKEVNVGGIGVKAGRSTLYQNVSASEEEKEDLRKLVDKGIRCYFRAVQSDPEEDVAKHL